MTASKAVRGAHELIGRALSELSGCDDEGGVIACHLQFAYDLLDEKIAEIGTAQSRSGARLPAMNHQGTSYSHPLRLVGGSARDRLN